MTVMQKSAPPVLVECMRGGHVESVHRGALAVTDTDGSVQYSIGDIDKLGFPRSAIKAVQALPMMESGAAERFGFSEAELAVACASHSGEALHVGLVRSMLRKAGIEETALLCGAHWPLGRESERALARKGKTPTSLHNNCSGKHAGMLAAIAHRGGVSSAYVDPHHPLQEEVCDILQDMSGIPIDRSKFGIDGCSLPNWLMPLRGMATLFARFATGSGQDQKRAKACRTLMRACFKEPEAMGGAGRFCSRILKAFPNWVFLKEGAEGVYCGAFPELGLGFAAKIEDGARRGTEVLIANLISALLPNKAKGAAILDDYRSMTLRNWSGTEMGAIRPSQDLVELLQKASPDDKLASAIDSVARHGTKL